MTMITNVSNQILFWRMLDANCNRAMEGVRVCEDICRFIDDDKELTSNLKAVRHQLKAIVFDTVEQKNLHQARNIEGDVGRISIDSEMTRTDIHDIWYANIQRAKESIRVLEETLKIIDQAQAERLKKCRYEIYRIEKTYSCPS